MTQPPAAAQDDSPPPPRPSDPAPAREAPPSEPAATRAGLDIDFATAGVVVLALTAVFAVLYLGKEVFFPVALAVILKLVLDPVVRWLGRFRLPSPVAAAILILGLLGLLGLGVNRLAAPVQDWVTRAPRTFEQAGRRLHALLRPLEEVNRAAESVQDVTAPSAGGAQEVTIRGPGLGERLAGTTQIILIGAAETLLLLYFLLAAGDLFLLKLIRVLPALHDKKTAVSIAREIEAAISAYLGTIFLLNLGFGAVVTLAMWGIGMPNPVLWGVAAAMCEFLPYIGAAFMLAILTIVSLSLYPDLGRALLVPAVYGAINLVQANVVSPLLLARRLTLNPVALFVGLLFWYWLWGVAGALLAVPMLAALKTVCDHVDSLAPIGEFLGD